MVGAGQTASDSPVESLAVVGTELAVEEEVQIAPVVLTAARNIDSRLVTPVLQPTTCAISAPLSAGFAGEVVDLDPLSYGLSVAIRSGTEPYRVRHEGGIVGSGSTEPKVKEAFDCFAKFSFQRSYQI